MFTLYDIFPFTAEEICCKCGCGYLKIDMRLIKKLTAARWIADIPFYPTSWCRCPKHELQVSGQNTSEHVDGLAVDVAATLTHNEWIILDAALKAGFTRIGIGRDFIHLGADPSRPQYVCWDYYEEK